MTVLATGAAGGFLGLDIGSWSLVGLAGTALFSTRFLAQWVASERRGESVIPAAFWWFSILGSVLMATYFIGRRDPVGILAYVPNCAVYIRNLQLEARRRRGAHPPAEPATAPRGAPHAA